MGDPFRVEGPALVSVSGGRSSGVMLRCILDAHGGRLPDDVICAFANTGEEAEGTLVFVREMAERWNIAIRWVEFTQDRNPLVSSAGYAHWREVDYCTASRKGEPFDAMVDWKQYLPNHSQKLCTEWLKVRAMHGLMASLGFDPGSREKDAERAPDFAEVIGIRADEPKRIETYRAKTYHGEGDYLLPLVDVKCCRGDVAAFWREQPFDLRIPQGEGNCRVCFEKGIAQLVNVIRDSPDGAGVHRFIAREARIGAPMHRRRSYAAVAARAHNQLPIWEPSMDADVDMRPCACGD